MKIFMTKKRTRKQTRPSSKPRASRVGSGNSSAVVAVVTPEGELSKIFPQDHAPDEAQEASLLAWAWHEDKPVSDFSPCTMPRDTETARTKGYRVISGRFFPNVGGQRRAELARPKPQPQ